MNLPFKNFLFAIIAASCAVTAIAIAVNCALQGSALFGYASLPPPESMHIRDEDGNWMPMERKRPDDYFYFSYERYRIRTKSAVKRSNLVQFFIPHIKIFSYYNTEGRRFGLLTATDAATNAKYACWITKTRESALPKIDSDCAIPETASLSSLEITLLRPTGFKEKLRTLKKNLYG